MIRPGKQRQRARVGLDVGDPFCPALRIGAAQNRQDGQHKEVRTDVTYPRRLKLDWTGCSDRIHSGLDAPYSMETGADSSSTTTYCTSHVRMKLVLTLPWPRTGHDSMMVFPSTLAKALGWIMEALPQSPQAEAKQSSGFPTMVGLFYFLISVWVSGLLDCLSKFPLGTRLTATRDALHDAYHHSPSGCRTTA